MWTTNQNTVWGCLNSLMVPLVNLLPGQPLYYKIDKVVKDGKTQFRVSGDSGYIGSRPTLPEAIEFLKTSMEASAAFEKLYDL